MFAPIVLFVYNRLLHTQKTVEALRRNELSADSILIIFSDAAKNEESINKVIKVRKYIENIKGFQSVQIVEREKNLGLAASVIQGVTDVVNKYGKVIVLEDDLITSPYFLTYMNKGLTLYQEEDDVISIHGYNFPIDLQMREKTFFIKGADCWGWATWKRGWSLFEREGEKLLYELTNNNLTHEFDFNGSYPYTQMLKDQINGKNDSWAILWYASAFLKCKYTLYPTHSLVINIGLDQSGTHSGKDSHYNRKYYSLETYQTFEKVPLIENSVAKEAIELFYKKHHKSSLKEKIIKWILKV